MRQICKQRQVFGNTQKKQYSEHISTPDLRVFRFYQYLKTSNILERGCFKDVLLNVADVQEYVPAEIALALF